MINAFLTGFFLGISLIVAIGAQNTFVLRQGIIGKYVWQVALFCAVSDTLLIIIGVIGISFFLNNFNNQISNFLFGFSSLWLFGYGILRLRSVFKSTETIKTEVLAPTSLLRTITIITVLTFANPHVYLDTMILIGSISQQFIGLDKFNFALGACFASFLFFFILAYTAKFYSSKMLHPYSWRILDLLVAVIMFSIALKLLYAGNWL